ncbi:hypothetical protein SAMN05216412_104153 [Nitrosospira multiformis]|uniref:Parallel beta helix pectate lyase-like protein n=1 Tax=Nitrosospira multiformis TaxID=1231 RepID=A0A1I0CZ22_9PROT|nr:right-handed parallel beta-helix repeat-containing protein [Nitrosospira multiformis]SET24750.1 hypothetical protein SAMN05216412_104153 [Nitrosospira multiformis]
MAEWFIRPDTSHSGTRNGQSYDFAWGGWSEIVWGSAGVVGGDTLYVCDSHSYAAILTIGAHGATSGSRVTIRGDYTGHPGVITFSSGTYYIDANRNYTTITALTINAGNNACISPGGAPLKALWITNCTFSCGAEAAIRFRTFNTWAYEDCIISGNSFNGGSGSTGGSAIQWYNTAAVVSTISNLQIYGNTFTNCSSQRAVILLRALNTVAVGTKLSDIVIRDNTFTNCSAVAVEAYGPETYGVHAGIRVYNNRITNQSQVGILGGGFSIGGFGPSATPGFGTNDIYNNWCSGLHGLTGFCNPMYGTYRIFNNYAENITSTDIDGCGVLFDHQCKDSVAFSNEFRNITGDSSTGNYRSGFGILVLDATNVTAFGNLIVNCVTGIAFGNKGPGQSSNIHNNTFVNCFQSGVYLVGGANNTTNIVRNNIFTTNNKALPAVKVDSAAWTGESNNCFYGFGAPSKHTLAASTITADPQLNNSYRPLADATKRKGVYLGGKDFYGKQFYNTPNIGAVEDVTNTPRYTLRYR